MRRIHLQLPSVNQAFFMVTVECFHLRSVGACLASGPSDMPVAVHHTYWDRTFAARHTAVVVGAADMRPSAVDTALAACAVDPRHQSLVVHPFVADLEAALVLTGQVLDRCQVVGTPVASCEQAEHPLEERYR